METALITTLISAAVPFVTAALRWVGAKLMTTVPAWLSPFRSLIAGYVVTKVAALIPGVPLPSDLTSITDPQSAALINAAAPLVIGGAAHIVTNWIDDLAVAHPKNKVIKWVASFFLRNVANPQPAAPGVTPVTPAA